MMHAAKLEKSPRLRRVHALLSDGCERSTLEIAIGARVCAVNSCIAELRANGAGITCRQVTSPAGERLFLYRMHRAAPEATSEGAKTAAGGAAPDGSHARARAVVSFLAGKFEAVFLCFQWLEGVADICHPPRKSRNWRV